MTFRAVIFDLGGVVMPSPLEAFRAYESANGLPHRFLSEVVLAGDDDSAWSRLERGELAMEQFIPVFESECTAAGGTIVGAELFASIHDGSGPRPVMVEAIDRIRAAGLKTAALTNNWLADGATSGFAGGHPLADRFDAIIESAVEGLRKPDPRIYELACARLAITPDEAVFLDDLGTNLKPARALGMTTIKVEDPDAAIAELAGVLGLPLTAGAGDEG